RSFSRTFACSSTLTDDPARHAGRPSGLPCDPAEGRSAGGARASERHWSPSCAFAWGVASASRWGPLTSRRRGHPHCSPDSAASWWTEHLRTDPLSLSDALWGWTGTVFRHWAEEARDSHGPVWLPGYSTDPAKGSVALGGTMPIPSAPAAWTS